MTKLAEDIIELSNHDLKKFIKNSLKEYLASEKEIESILIFFDEMMDKKLPLKKIETKLKKFEESWNDF